MNEHRSLTVGEVARIARVSVRTLHHYDAIGLLQPGTRSRGDYRLYSRADLERLFRIRLYAALGVPLAEVKRILDEERVTREEALSAHRSRLLEQVDRFRFQIRTLDRLLENPNDMNPEEIFRGLEAEERWGETPQWRESARRTKNYDKAQLAALREESDGLLKALGEARVAGESPQGEEVLGLVEAYRLHIDRWFYPLTREGHVALGAMYVEDSSFRETFESIAPGLAEFVKEAIEANARRTT